MYPDPSRTDCLIVLLDDILAEKLTLTDQKIANLRRIEATAKRMADGIERQKRDAQRREAIDA